MEEEEGIGGAGVGLIMGTKAALPPNNSPDVVMLGFPFMNEAISFFNKLSSFVSLLLFGSLLLVVFGSLFVVFG